MPERLEVAIAGFCFEWHSFSIFTTHIYPQALKICVCVGVCVCVCVCVYVYVLNIYLPGSSPGGSREFKAGTVSARIRKQLFN